VIAMISRSLCVMRMTVLPLSAQNAKDAEKVIRSAGVRTPWARRE